MFLYYKHIIISCTIINKQGLTPHLMRIPGPPLKGPGITDVVGYMATVSCILESLPWSTGVRGQARL